MIYISNTKYEKIQGFSEKRNVKLLSISTNEAKNFIKFLFSKSWNFQIF